MRILETIYMFIFIYIYLFNSIYTVHICIYLYSTAQRVYKAYHRGVFRVKVTEMWQTSICLLLLLFKATVGSSNFFCNNKCTPDLPSLQVGEALPNSTNYRSALASSALSCAMLCDAVNGNPAKPCFAAQFDSQTGVCQMASNCGDVQLVGSNTSTSTYLPRKSTDIEILETSAGYITFWQP